MRETGNARFKKTRWCLVIAMLMAGIVLAVVGTWQVCLDQVASLGDRPVVTTCRPPSVLDPPVLMAVFLTLLAIWPELSEMGVGGILSIKRRDRVGADLPIEKIAKVAKESSAEPITRDQAAALHSMSEHPNLRFEVPIDGAGASAEVGTFLATWAVTEAVLGWVANAEQRIAAGGKGLRVINPPLRPLLGTAVPSESEQEVLSVVRELLKPYGELISAARSARNLVVHSGQAIDSSVLTQLIEGLARMHGAVRLAAMHIVETS